MWCLVDEEEVPEGPHLIPHETWGFIHHKGHSYHSVGGTKLEKDGDVFTQDGGILIDTDEEPIDL